MFRRKPHPAPYPTAPPEIWALILHHATRYAVADAPFMHRLAQHKARVKWKAGLSRVSRLWNWMAQEYLYEDIWLSKASEARWLSGTLCGPSIIGLYIRRLHVETPTLERCSPHDILLILQHCPALVTFKDAKSIQRPMYALIMSPSNPIAPFCSIFTTLLSVPPPLKHLAYTHYTYDPSDFEAGVYFFVHVVHPGLELVSNLESLELSMSLNGTGMLGRKQSLSFPSTPSPQLSLPRLRTLKTPLDNTYLFLLSTWSLPSLTSISIHSTHLSFAHAPTSVGFQRFFHVHGPVITHLELLSGYGAVEERWITDEQGSSINAAIERGLRPSSHPDDFLTSLGLPLCSSPERTYDPFLPNVLPNLHTLVCSSDAEWNWQIPDWISPHELVPFHPTVQVICIRDLERRVLGDLGEWEGRRRSDPLGDDEEEDPFFKLLQQFSSILRHDAFPSLRSVRDLSGVSAKLRKESWRVAFPPTTPMSPPTTPTRPTSLRKKASTFFRSRVPSTPTIPKPPTSTFSLSVSNMTRIGRFWKNVLDICVERGVVLEDWKGRSVVF